MRNFENARKLGKNLCELNAMTDLELNEALRVVNLKFDVKLDWDGFNPKPWGAADTVTDISKSWRVSSKAERGIAIK